MDHAKKEIADYYGMVTALDDCMGVILDELKKTGKVNIKTKYQLASIEGGEKIKSINIKSDDGKELKIETDYILSFFGLIMKLGPIS